MTPRGPCENMRTRIGQNLSIFVAALFLLASLALALHHEDRPFETVSCSICEVQGATAGTHQKVKAESDLSATVNPLPAPEACIVYVGWLPEPVATPLPSEPFFAYTNKAPPVQL